MEKNIWYTIEVNGSPAQLLTGKFLFHTDDKYVFQLTSLMKICVKQRDILELALELGKIIIRYGGIQRFVEKEKS